MATLGTKAETLRKIQGHLENAVVLPQFMFTVGEWEKEQRRIRNEFEALEWKEAVIVRSSSLCEDTNQASLAGKYESIANVVGMEAFIQAVDKVISSYDDNNKKNQILIQPMLSDVRECGVAFTLDPNTLGNYYVINYNENGSTDAITSGRNGGGGDRLYYIFKNATNNFIPDEIRCVVTMLKELELFFDRDNLDVEFARDLKGNLYILQVRALCVGEERIDINFQKEELKRIEDKIALAQSKKPFLCGDKALYSVMTDWNPAEMIGIRPKPLAMSLYREIITDSVWAYQRDNYGYRNLRSFPLMVDFGGLPYIDVRVSFNSFIPAELDERVSEKLVNYYLDRLIDAPQKHDKAEFEIVFSCYTLDLPERIKILQSYGFLPSEIDQIVDALRNVTNHIIDYKAGLWRKDYEKIQKLEKRYGDIMSSDMNEIEKVYWLLEDCKRYGTLPFAGLARGAFIAVQILQSMVTCHILGKEDYENFMKSVNTVGSNMSKDRVNMSKKAFLEKYGHLRPGTYDINSLRYDEAPNLYFEWNDDNSNHDEMNAEIFRISLRQLNSLKSKLVENGLKNDVLELLDYIKAVIEGREYGKFIFTKNLSKALSLIAEIGNKYGLTKEDCAYLNIQAVRELFHSTKEIRKDMVDSIIQGKASYKVTQGLTLPPVIVDSKVVWGFYYPDTEPNYITSGRIVGAVCVLENTNQIEEMEGKIVFISSADPGYDWIFSHGIKGFVTMYGGANSHMAIRAGEFGIPAVVGIGAKEYDMYRSARNIEIDCAAKIIRVLK